PLHAKPLPEPAPARWFGSRLLLADREGAARTHVVVPSGGRIDDGTVSWSVRLEPRERRELQVDVLPSMSGRATAPPEIRRFGLERERVRDSLEVWHLRVPRLETRWDDLRHAYRRSVSDLASLRMRGGSAGLTRLPAAGMPWFMTVFGRDT